VEKAQRFIDGFYETYEDVTRWKGSALRQARKDGFVKTMSGRKRRLDLLDSEDYKIRGRQERQAINAIIQGSAADICKDAMVALDEVFEGTPMQLLLQVHDELVCLVPDDWVDKAIEIIPEAMGHGTMLRGVRVEATGKAGTRWSEAK
jgi:DNA polymerase I